MARSSSYNEQVCFERDWIELHGNSVTTTIESDSRANACSYHQYETQSLRSSAGAIIGLQEVPTVMEGFII